MGIYNFFVCRVFGITLMKALSFKMFFASLSVALLSACGGDEKPAQATTDSTPQNTTQSTGTVYKVGVEAPYPPYVQLGESGKYEGFDVDILTEIGKREGFTIDIQTRAWDGIYEFLGTKELDIIASGGFDTPERRAKYAFSQPYHVETIVLISQNPNAKSFNDAKGKRISYVVGGAEESIAKELSDTNTLDISLGTSSSWESIKNIIQNKADFAINTSSIYAYYAKQYPDQKLQVVHQDNPERFNVAFGVNQNDTELLNKLNNGLNAIKADGTYDKVKAKWFAATMTQ